MRLDSPPHKEDFLHSLLSQIPEKRIEWYEHLSVTDVGGSKVRTWGGGERERDCASLEFLCSLELVLFGWNCRHPFL